MNIQFVKNNRNNINMIMEFDLQYIYLLTRWYFYQVWGSSWCMVPTPSKQHYATRRADCGHSSLLPVGLLPTEQVFSITWHWLGTYYTNSHHCFNRVLQWIFQRWYFLRKDILRKWATGPAGSEPQTLPTKSTWKNTKLSSQRFSTANLHSFLKFFEGWT